MINPISQMLPNNTISLALDDATDLANLPTYAENNHLAMGSSAIVIDTGKVYMMKSDKTWKEV